MQASELTESLERALVRAIAKEWHTMNGALFRWGLRPPAIALTESTAHLGRWVLHTRTLEISRVLVITQSWGVVLEVLKHEMAHQYAHEVLRAHDEAAHGPAFRQVCERLGIDARASGMPKAPDEHNRMAERIARLLALAESPNVHEAEAAMAAAQKLMLKHNLEQLPKTRGYVYRHLGAPSGRTSEGERILASILASHFFVEAIWIPVYRPLEGKRGSVLEICGTPENVEIAEYVHGYLLQTSERLWIEHKRAQRIRGNRDRRTYVAGVMTGFAEKLRREQRVHRQEGLVWVGDAELETFFRKRHPLIRHVRHAGQRRTEAYAHGREAGQQIVLRRAVQSTTTERGLLLGRGSR